MIAVNIESVRHEIEAACVRSGRSTKQCSLIAVSKTFSTDDIREAIVAGQVIFGESRLQEAEPKIVELPSKIHWHYIGRLQRNKLRKILQIFEVIHSIDSLRMASHADEVAIELSVFPQVFLQVNLSGEESKGGFDPDILISEFESLLTLKRLAVIGLMTIPPNGDDAELTRPWFIKLRELRDRLEAKFGVSLPSLSMGMSGDFKVAIEEGATHVRVGSLIFGKRSGRGQEEQEVL